ncbi:MAG TPA: trehalose-phosphatase [Streptosporangiaceae bacterium]|nr:trehalose-phosphatase [Streptosporangiaceae bacterium]
MDPAALPEPGSPEGRAGLAAILGDPARALIALDFDGTLSPIVADPAQAWAHPAAAQALRRVAAVAGTLAVITGRPAGSAAELGGFATVPGLIVLGHYGLERWADGTLDSPPPEAGVAAARAELPGLLAGAAAPAGTRAEYKGHAVAVHTRQTADPQAALDQLRGPLTELAARHGLAMEPGRMVIELRPRGMDKGQALKSLVSERQSGAVMYVGDDLGDRAAFGAVRALRATGIPGLTVCSGSAEVTALADEADLVVDGPDGVVALLGALAGTVSRAG